MTTPDTAYGVALSMLLDGYKKIHSWGHFENDIMIIYWQSGKKLIELVIEKRRKEPQKPKIEHQDEIKNHEKKKDGAWQKVRKMLSFMLKSVAFIHPSRKNTD